MSLTVFLILVFSEKGMFNTDVFYDRRLLFYFLKWVIVNTKSSKWLILLLNEIVKSKTSVHIQFWIENCLCLLQALMLYYHSGIVDRSLVGWAFTKKAIICLSRLNISHVIPVPVLCLNVSCMYRCRITIIKIKCYADKAIHRFVYFS